MYHLLDCYLLVKSVTKYNNKIGFNDMKCIIMLPLKIFVIRLGIVSIATVSYS